MKSKRLAPGRLVPNWPSSLDQESSKSIPRVSRWQCSCADRSRPALTRRVLGAGVFFCTCDILFTGSVNSWDSFSYFPQSDTVKRFMAFRRGASRLAVIAMTALTAASIASAKTPGSLNSAAPEGAAATATDAVVWHEDFSVGWAESRRSGRPMLIFITSDHCRYCDAMKQQTFRDQNVLGRLKNRFVAIRLSPIRNAQVLKRIHVPAYPMTLIGVPEGKILDHRVGFQPAADFLRLLDRAGPASH